MFRFIQKLSYFAVVVCWLFLFIATTSFASPPHPDIRDGVIAGKIAAPYFMEHIAEMHQKGICTGDKSFFKNESIKGNAASDAPKLSGQFKALCILVDFSDKASQVNPVYFDSLLFSTSGSTVKAYYNEISYGQLDLVTVNLPSSIGWIEAPQTYAYYVNGQNGTGNYPNNTQKLCEDVIDAINGVINFSNYDNDGDGEMDCLIIAHSGQGAEYTGSNNDIWSHKWSIAPRVRDGVSISSYTIQPEYWRNPNDMTIGVYAHELGHGFGLDDLYDLDGSSRGIGTWGIMSYGSWLGPNNLGGSPAHPCAFNRIKMGFAVPVIVATDSRDQQIEQVETGGNIYRLWTGGNISNEYFLVENRQQVGFDSYLPGSGLMIWHIDENMDANTYEWWPGKDSTFHYQVALEQADGHFDLEIKYNYGDKGDPFPGERYKFDFNAVSTPSSNSYTNGVSYVMVTDISYSDSIMQADFTVGFSSTIPDPEDPPQLPATLKLMQNYPNPFNPTTSISYSVSSNSLVKLEIYNIEGQRIRILVDELKEAGTYEVEWDGKNNSGMDVSSGIYLYRIISGYVTDSKKMILIR